MPTMRILIFSSKGRGTGCILRACGIANAFRHHGHRVTLVPPFPTMPLWLDMALDMFWYFIAGLFVKADLAIGIKPYPTLIPVLAWQKGIHRATIVLDVDDLDYAYSGGLFRSIHKALQLPWPRRCDLVTYHNPNLRGPLVEVFHVEPGKLVPLPQGVEMDVFRKFDPSGSSLPGEARPLLRDRPEYLLVYTAHLNGACGLREILESFALVAATKLGARLLVAGGGPDEYLFREEARKRGLASRVTFTGMITQAQVAACLNLADLVLVYYGPGPANDHRASMKLREALACRARVVATGVGETVHFARHVHLSAADPSSFAQAVLSALKSRPKPALPSRALAALNWSACVQPLERRVSRP